MPTKARQPAEDRRQRLARGGFYTSPEIARYLAARALDRVGSAAVADRKKTLRLLDPACGDGVFLGCALEELVCRLASREPSLLLSRYELSLRIARDHLFGIDRDPRAVAAARGKLAEWIRLGHVEASDAGRAEIDRVLFANIRHADALLDCFVQAEMQPSARGGQTVEQPRDDSPGSRLPSGASPWNEPFDVILANPPYLNIRRLSKDLPAPLKHQLRARFACATGAYDMYVLFVELAWHLLREGGVCGLVVPNKIASADYATACRKLLLERTRILEIVDAADLRVFPGTGVYPYLMLWQKQTAPRGHRVRVRQPRALADLRKAGSDLMLPQSGWNPATGFPLERVMDVERRVPTLPLAECAHLESGTTGFHAGKLAGQLLEAREARARGLCGKDWFEFVVSGNIDRYEVRRGPLRFMKHRFERPVLPSSAGVLSDAKQRLFRGEKIVVAGMTRRLEAAHDPGGLALGVQVYAVVPNEMASLYLLALLNSKLLSHWFRARFAAKRLGGGYLAINKKQLECLPIRRIRPAVEKDRELYGKLLTRAAALQSLRGRGPEQAERMGRGELDRAEQAVDRLVYALYALKDAEINRVEAGCF